MELEGPYHAVLDEHLRDVGRHQAGGVGVHGELQLVGAALAAAVVHHLHDERPCGGAVFLQKIARCECACKVVVCLYTMMAKGSSVQHLSLQVLSFVQQLGLASLVSPAGI